MTKTIDERIMTLLILKLEDEIRAIVKDEIQQHLIRMLSVLHAIFCLTY
jgi:hypothetical protein